MRDSVKTYKIAEVVFELLNPGSYVRNLCEDYEVDAAQKSEFSIKISKEDILKERSLTEENVTDEYLESLAVYRKLCEKMVDYDTFLFHCSAVAVDGKAYLFAAPSGTGKSTHTRLWRTYFGDRAVMVNDDKPLLQVRDEAIYVCGTPWCGKHGLNTNQKVPIQGICILERGRENSVEKISTMEAFAEMYKQTYRSGERGQMIKTIALLKQLAERIPVYRMKCNISEQAVETSWNTMKPQ